MLLCLLLASACGGPAEKKAVIEDTARIGSIEVMDERALQYVDRNQQMEVLAEGHEWTEGPVWLPAQNMLLYSDIPRNSIYAWQEGRGSELYLKPSGYTGKIERVGEPGSNGLLLDPEGKLVLCQHGDRQIGRLVGSLEEPAAVYETVADRWEGQRLNSPNDAAYHSNGMLYFTDPPYGLEKNMDDPTKEIPFQGVYRIGKDGSVELLIDSITRPNGIAFSPDFLSMYVACSDGSKAQWHQYALSSEGDILSGRVLHDVTSYVGKEKGLPDGLKVHPDGTLFATGPGGVWILSAEGTPLALIRTGEATANCAFDDDYKNLYITADMYLLRLPLKH
ncbi:MAG: SMP-30/gluconolactonase/LRE family protein [Saprospiraceae bacterium]|nr:SMP-30/gluconolactonase/LRE family protein [Saprospiraceae bacterium]